MNLDLCFAGAFGPVLFVTIIPWGLFQSCLPSTTSTATKALRLRSGESSELGARYPREGWEVALWTSTALLHNGLSCEVTIDSWMARKERKKAGTLRDIPAAIIGRRLGGSWTRDGGRVARGRLVLLTDRLAWGWPHGSYLSCLPLAHNNENFATFVNMPCNHTVIWWCCMEVISLCD